MTVALRWMKCADQVGERGCQATLIDGKYDTMELRFQGELGHQLHQQGPALIIRGCHFLSDPWCHHAADSGTLRGRESRGIQHTS